MIFIISLIISILMVYFGHETIKKHCGFFYGLSTVIALVVIAFRFTESTGLFPEWFKTWIWPIFARGSLATALFVMVMYGVVLPNGSKMMKHIMYIRGELSIIAAILTLGHNIGYGKKYFYFLFVSPENLQLNQLLAAICSILMILIMIPLFSTSFKSVRKKLKPSSWKKLQRMAYAFYALIYIHVLLLTLPNAIKGESKYLITVLAFSVVFITYAVLRVKKAKEKRYAKFVYGGLVAAITAVLMVTLFNPFMQTPKTAEKQINASAEKIEKDLPEEKSDLQEPEVEEQTEVETEDKSEQQVIQPVTEKQENTPTEKQETTKTVENQVTYVQPQTEKPEVKAAEKPVDEVQASQPAPVQAPQPVVTEKVVEKEPEPVYKYKNGTFSGSGEGFEGSISVSVKIENDKILDISVTNSSDDEPYLSEGKGVISRIISAQSADVDTVSGATFSSRGIINAVKSALSSAKN